MIEITMGAYSELSPGLTEALRLQVVLKPGGAVDAQAAVYEEMPKGTGLWGDEWMGKTTMTVGHSLKSIFVPWMGLFIKFTVRCDSASLRDHLSIVSRRALLH